MKETVRKLLASTKPFTVTSTDRLAPVAAPEISPVEALIDRPSGRPVASNETKEAPSAVMTGTSETVSPTTTCTPAPMEGYSMDTTATWKESVVG